MILDKEQLQETIKLLQQRLNPEAIYLFGSQTTGKASQERGDVDLCIIVGDDKEPYRETVNAYESLQNMLFPKDIIVRRKSRFEERSAWPYTLEYEVRQTGRMIYPHA
jgi:predicted nucleotidyltransferase